MISRVISLYKYSFLSIKKKSLQLHLIFYISVTNFTATAKKKKPIMKWTSFKFDNIYSDTLLFFQVLPVYETVYCASTLFTDDEK